jgi:branched-chain amino acid transport system ATP-binding protein
MSPLLEVRGLRSFYGQAQILFDLGLEVREGEVAVLLGRNGAGKTTALKSIMGLVPPATGEIRYLDEDVAGRHPYRIARLGVGYVPEDRRIFTDLTVEENLEVGRREPLNGQAPWTPERLFRLFPNLAGMRRRRGGQMSGGEQQMLAIARTLMGNPRLLLLDEPSEGLAPVIVEQMARSICELKVQGLAVLLSEQNLHFAEAVGDRAYVIEAGHIRYEGAIDSLVRDHGARRQWLSM